MAEEDFHPSTHVTKKMTGGVYDVPRENTRVNSWEEQDYLANKEYYAATLGVDFYKIGATIHEGLKLSKDGEEREEYTRVLERKTEEPEGRDVGWRIIKRVFGKKDQTNGSSPEE